MNAVYDVVILGAGYAGLMGALCLRRMKETFRIARL
jgi:2-polyprenyl-6-methoxyphenol hydroxylase-like FAD-dependent oxidoreductase